jgi:catechol 2,3-dioxygenase-like lactoylglutathione lyase family enzyme
MRTRDEPSGATAPNGFVRACPYPAFIPNESTSSENAMQLNHLDLPVPDVAATAAFFTAHFGFRLCETRGNNGFALLQGAGGFLLVLTRRRAEATQNFPDTFHIGFLVDSEAAVHAAHARLQAAGVAGLPAVSFQRGATLFYVHAPGGVLVEVSHRSSV